MLDVEADCYWCLCKLLEGIQDHYTYAQPGIQRTVFRLKELVRWGLKGRDGGVLGARGRGDGSRRCMCKPLDGIHSHCDHAQPSIQRTVFRLMELVSWGLKGRDGGE